MTSTTSTAVDPALVADLASASPTAQGAAGLSVRRPASDHLPRPESRRRRATVQLTACTALAVTLAYLTWRTATLDGSSLWLSIPLLVLELHALFSLALFTHDLWDLDVRPDPGRDVPTELRQDVSQLSVAILIPTYNEPMPILLPTIAAAVAARGSHVTWVLDDGDRPWVRELAAELGARYRSRVRGAHAKAGNINEALEEVGTDLVAVVDADHVVTDGFLQALLPYFADPGLALVQTPQDFFNESSFEHVQRSGKGVFADQTMFYRVILAGRNRWGAGFWCGTGGMVRVSALLSVGGVATDSVTEDIQTTLRLHRKGWRTIHHNEVLAHGLAADDAGAFYTQRNRWGAGGMQVLKRDNPARGAGLTLHQRLCYLSTLLGWFESWRTIGYVLLPAATLLTGGNPVSADWRVFVVAYGACFISQRLAIAALSRGRAPLMNAWLFEFIRLPATFAATLALFTSGPSRFAVTPKSASESRSRAPAPLLLKLLLAASLIAAGWYGATLVGLTPVTYTLPWVAHGAMAWLVINVGFLIAAAHRIRHERFAGNRRDSWRFTTDPVPVQVDLAGGPTIGADLTDVSLAGARLTIVGATLAPGDRIVVHLPLGRPDGRVDILSLPAEVRTAITDPSTGGGLAGLLLSASPEQQARLALALYQTCDA